MEGKSIHFWAIQMKLAASFIILPLTRVLYKNGVPAIPAPRSFYVPGRTEDDVKPTLVTNIHVTNLRIQGSQVNQEPPYWDRVYEANSWMWVFTRSA